KRKGSLGQDEYGFPGGHVELGESFSQTAIREVKEETGTEIQNLKFEFVANVTTYYPKHYIHIGFVADWRKGEPKILEPHKTEEWKWYSLSSLPSPIFEFSKLALIAHKTGKSYFDAK
ncbi:MAG: NUDIX domain-containing protein, partial [Candidatus Levybacteria bacterium]|nr:NUDIX domain-containing protein [Candidatus Levybacteria bacterium]